MIEPFPWNDAFAVGDKRLDEEHRRMVGLINQICICADLGQHAKSISLMTALQFVAESHARNEDAPLTRIDIEIAHHPLHTVVDAAIEEHAREHRHKLAELRELTERWRAINSHADELWLCDELKAWFIDHTTGYEARIKTVLQSIRPAG